MTSLNLKLYEKKKAPKKPPMNFSMSNLATGVTIRDGDPLWDQMSQEDSNAVPAGRATYWLDGSRSIWR